MWVSYSFERYESDRGSYRLDSERFPDAVFIGTLFRTWHGFFCSRILDLFDVYISKNVVIVKDNEGFLPSGGVSVRSPDDIIRLTSKRAIGYKMWREIFKHVKFSDGSLKVSNKLSFKI